MGRWEKADLDDSQNEELLTEDLEDLLDEAYGRRPTPTPTPSPPSWVAPLQEDQDSQVLADLSKPANPTEAVSINSPEATTSRNALLDHLGKELPQRHHSHCGSAWVGLAVPFLEDGALAHLMMLPLLDVLAGELDSEDVALAQAARNELLNLAEYLEEDVPVQAYVNDWQRNQIVPLNYLSTVPGADLHTLAALLHEMGNFVQGLAVHQHGHRDQPPPGGPIIEQSTVAIYPLPDMHGREL